MAQSKAFIPDGFTTDTNPKLPKEGQMVVVNTEGAAHSVFKMGEVVIVDEILDGIRLVAKDQSGLRQILFPRQYDIVKIKKIKPKVFDLTKLDPLVVSEAVKTEIIAVLRQQKHTDKIFKDWGLGETIEYGRGMTFLFYGQPGTGKTWAASCIAKAMGKELLTIGAAEIQTQEPGGANRNIKEAFSSARTSDKVLFLDECDSLITNRNDVGMILGSEINTLLTEIEKSEGVVILATNRIENLDLALERRIALIIEFPEPNFEGRELIWAKLIPKKLPLDREVTPKKLAEYKLTGGQIKNVILQAARLAASAESKTVTLEHITTAINRLKQSQSLMGKASRYNQVIREEVTRS